MKYVIITFLIGIAVICIFGFFILCEEEFDGQDECFVCNRGDCEGCEVRNEKQ